MDVADLGLAFRLRKPVHHYIPGIGNKCRRRFPDGGQIIAVIWFNAAPLHQSVDLSSSYFDPIGHRLICNMRPSRMA